MKKTCLLVLLLLVVSAMPSVAQDTKFELFGGYSYLRGNPGGGLPTVDTSGWEASVAYNWNSWLALKADFDGHYCCDGAKMHDFLGGPQINFGHGELRPYIHALVGVSHGSQGTFSDTVLAFAGGGGVDVKITDRFAWRVAQVDYFGTRYADHTQNNFRLSTGLVFHFGKK